MNTVLEAEKAEGTEGAEGERTNLLHSLKLIKIQVKFILLLIVGGRVEVLRCVEGE
jgi:hypothetical protein